MFGRRTVWATFAVAASAALLFAAPASASANAGTVQPRIVGGSTASVSQYPWQAALVNSPAKDTGDAHDRQFCGGSLLTSRIVITAAHCVSGYDPDCTLTCPNNPLEADDLNVILGFTTLSTVPESAEIPVQAIKVQANYQDNYQGDEVPRYDAAYLVLPSASSQTPIKIAGTDEGALWGAGSPVDISGWGTTSESPSANTVNTLRAATVDVIADSTCDSDYGIDFDSNTMVCAGLPGGGVDTCSGDSGGPLEAPVQGGGYRLVGITGWGEGCAEAQFPGVYTRVAGPTMRSLIQSDVSTLESSYGLPAEGIFGGGGQSLGAVASGTATPASSSNALKKCKRVHNKKKRRRCIKKARKRIKAGT